jgi:hypothetical protein
MFASIQFATLTSHLLSKNKNIKMYKTIILPVILYHCKTWSFTPEEEHRLRVSEKRVLQGISRPIREEVVGNWRKLHNEKLCNLSFSPNITRVIKARGMR